MDSNVEGGSISQTDPTIGDPNFDLRNELLAGEDGFLLPLENDKEGGSSTSPWQPRFFCPSLPPLPPPPSPPTLPSQPLPPYYGEFYNIRPSSALAGLAGSERVLLSGVSSSSPFGALHAEIGNLTAQDIMDAKAIAASKSHSEAERRRRERINAHLAKLRSLLPSTTKTDKASLLAEVVRHVKELKRQTSEMAEEEPLPTEADEVIVHAGRDVDGRLVVNASVCCEDRSDLLPELIKALKSVRLRILKAEITTLGGRVRNVLVVTGDDCHDERQLVSATQDALKGVMERAAAADESPSGGGGGSKRQRTVAPAILAFHLVAVHDPDR
ncbi:hypothetical protein HPP92_015656 [Vanilla planifolia]|uniref:BHLH domain-containing protein n=1 Tax=Vanilla planifolia TaxID=51239 RepID=A0A835QDE3_VANPL|nr:hypothetical protein HPP92_015656 [Vanilla planifolia]